MHFPAEQGPQSQHAEYELAAQLFLGSIPGITALMAKSWDSERVNSSLALEQLNASTKIKIDRSRMPCPYRLMLLRHLGTPNLFPDKGADHSETQHM